MQSATSSASQPIMRGSLNGSQRIKTRIKSLEGALFGADVGKTSPTGKPWPIGWEPRLEHLEKRAYGTQGVVTDCPTGMYERLDRLEGDFGAASDEDILNGTKLSRK